MNLSGRTVMVTGAAGAIGSAILGRLLLDGARVVAVDQNGAGLESLRNTHAQLEIVVADVSKPADCDRAAASAGARVDILINNAAVADGGGSIDELEDTVWSRVLDVNLTAAFLLSRRVIGPMLAAKAGVIVNMSSVAGLRGARTGVAYTASKWALVGMAQNIAATLGPEGIRAYAICPAVVVGALTLGNVPPTARSARNRGRDRGQPEPTTPQDVAETVAFLVSDKARHLNGIAVPIDRGWLAY